MMARWLVVVSPTATLECCHRCCALGSVQIIHAHDARAVYQTRGTGFQAILLQLTHILQKLPVNRFAVPTAFAHPIVQQRLDGLDDSRFFRHEQNRQRTNHRDALRFGELITHAFINRTRSPPAKSVRVFRGKYQDIRQSTKHTKSTKNDLQCLIFAQV